MNGWMYSQSDHCECTVLFRCVGRGGCSRVAGGSFTHGGEVNPPHHALVFYLVFIHFVL